MRAACCSVLGLGCQEPAILDGGEVLDRHCCGAVMHFALLCIFFALFWPGQLNNESKREGAF